jgi:hypothetical protein
VFRCLALSAAAVAAALAIASPAGAIAPSLLLVGQQNRHPTASFSAPKASSVTISFATKPDRATDGHFLTENVVHTAFLTDAEIQAGRWLDESQMDPGTYYVLLEASPSFDQCYQFDAGTYDPACADGFSDVVKLLVPRPTTRYAAHVTVLKYVKEADLVLAAKPLGAKQPYRVCFRVKSGKRRCVNGSLDGYDWNSGTSDELTVPTGNLPTRATFTWYVGAKRIAAKTVRTR